MVGDALEQLVSENFDSLLGDWCAQYSSDFAWRAMADLAFTGGILFRGGCQDAPERYKVQYA